MRVLFVPHPMPSHLIPLVALQRSLANQPGITHAFLLPKELHEFATQLGARVLKVDRRLEDGIRPEMAALAIFHPDIVVDDLSPTTAFLVRMMSLPRVSIVRKGLFPGEQYPAGYRHSSDILQHFQAIKAMNLRAQNLWEPEELSDLFVGDLNLIPSSPEIEVLPLALRGDNTYRYIGPLLLDDHALMANLHCLDLRQGTSSADFHRFSTLAPKRDLQAIPQDLARFLESNRDRQLIYFNVGLAYPKELYDKGSALIEAMLETGAAVVSNIDAPLQEGRDRLFAAACLPMHLVCARADLMVHQCGSGTYNYQIMHERPAVILGSDCYDRDCVGARLDEIGAATFFKSAQIATVELARFKETLHTLLNRDGQVRRRQSCRLEQLHAGLLRVRRQFEFGQALRETIARFAAKKEINGPLRQSIPGISS